MKDDQIKERGEGEESEVEEREEGEESEVEEEEVESREWKVAYQNVGEELRPRAYS